MKLTRKKDKHFMWNEFYSLYISNEREIHCYNKLSGETEIIDFKKINVYFIFYKIQDYRKIRSSFMSNDLDENSYYLSVCKVSSLEHPYLSGFYLRNKKLPILEYVICLDLKQIELEEISEEDFTFGYYDGKGIVFRTKWANLFVKGEIEEPTNVDKYNGTQSINFSGLNEKKRINYDNKFYLKTLILFSKKNFRKISRKIIFNACLIFGISMMFHLFILNMFRMNTNVFFFYKYFSLLYFNYLTYYFIDKSIKSYFEHVTIEKNNIMFLRLKLLVFVSIYFICINLFFRFSIKLLVFVLCIYFLYNLLLVFLERIIISFIQANDLSMLEDEVYKIRGLKRTRLFCIETLGAGVLLFCNLFL